MAREQAVAGVAVLRGGWRFAAALVEVTGRAAVLMVAAST
jgi:hypothetical protein